MSRGDHSHPAAGSPAGHSHPDHLEGHSHPDHLEGHSHLDHLDHLDHLEGHNRPDHLEGHNRRPARGGGGLSSSLLAFSRSLAGTRESRTKAFVPLQRIWFCRYLMAVVVSGLFSACAKRNAADNPELHPVYVRGDRVVAEQSAAQFFEGRVLSVQGERLRLQAIGGNDSLNVVASDVYPLPAAPHDLTPNMLAICGRGEAWLPCRLMQVTGSTLAARTATGESFDLTRDRVLVPSALTELNLKRHFARSEAEQAFAQAAAHAGEPRPEPGWRPALRERLLVKVGTDWFTGYVREIEDDRAQVTLSSAQRSATVPLSALSAEPPSSFVSEVRRGDFVLFRPDTSSLPWSRMQVRALNGVELKLADASGTLKSATVREVVPLRP